MRTIKFRGKRVDDGEWVYGSYVACWQHDYDGEPSIVHQICDGDGYSFNVYPETVGQFTGLKDKNGVDIYEGEVLTRTAHPQIYYGVGKDDYNIHKGLVCRYEVIYNELQPSFEIKLIYVSEKGVKVGCGYKTEIAVGDRFSIYSIDGYTPKCKLTIVGNIHDNHELLTKNN